MHPWRRLGAVAALFLLAALPDAALAQTARIHHTTTLLPDGSFLIVGGEDGAGDIFESVQLFRSTDSTVVSLAPLPSTFGRSSHTATLLGDGRVFVAGGLSDNANTDCPLSGAGNVCNTARVYDPQTNAWSAAIAMGTARVNHTATLLNSGKVLVCGGQPTLATLTSNCELFTPGSPGSFSAAASLRMARSHHSSNLLYNGKVFVAGGIADDSTQGGADLLDFAVPTELYDPDTNLWTPGPNLIQKRAYHATTPMGNRNILITGGFNGRDVLANQGILQTVEIYNPVADSISPAAPMFSRRMFHTGTLDPGGQVSIYGGLGNITTSFFPGNSALDDGSTFSRLNLGAPQAIDSGTIQGSSDLRVTLNTQLSVGADGVIAEGDVLFSSPTVTLSDSKIFFANPGTRAILNGVEVNSGRIENARVQLVTPAGTAKFSPRNEASKEANVAAGSMCFGNPTGGQAIASGATGNINGTVAAGACAAEASRTLTAAIDVPFPAHYIAGVSQVLLGSARILSGTIARSPSDTFQGFTMNLTSGTGTIPGTPTIVDDGLGGKHLIATVVFTGVEGLVTNSTTSVINSPINDTDNDAPASDDAQESANMMNGGIVTNLSLRLLYIASPVNLGNQQFQFDIATVTIRKMVLGDDERYSPNTNTWSFNTPGAPRFNHSSLLLPNADEVITGGRTCLGATCGSFQAQAGSFAYIQRKQDAISWSNAGNHVTARGNHTLTLLPSGRLLAAGGTNGPSVLNSAELYNPQTRTWSSTGAMTRARNLHTGTLLPNGTVLVAGGFSTQGSTGATNSAEIFYPETGTWVPTGLMTSSRSYHTATLLPDGNVLAVGGYDDTGSYLATAEIYYSTGRVWRPIGGLGANNERAQHTASLLQDGRVLVAGGANSALGVLNSVMAYSPATGLWTTIPPANLNTRRHSHTATLLRDGRVLVVGGNDGFGEIGRAEVYDPLANTWTLTENLGGGNRNDIGKARMRHTAQLLPDGKVLVTGGMTALGGAISLSEGYDVDRASWQVQGRMNNSRGEHAAALLLNGRMLVSGGNSGLGYAFATEDQYYSATPDGSTGSGTSIRVPLATSVDTGTFTGGGAVTVLGSRFKGNGEGSGGRDGGVNSSFHHPRVYLQRLDSGGNGTQGHSGFLVDLTSNAYFGAGNAWSKMDSSITVRAPAGTNRTPVGYFAIRIAANAQFSDGVVLQAGPARPSGQPGVPVGSALGVSSVSWSWTAAAGAFEGYNVYSATDGVFIGTTPTNAFLQTGLGPDSVVSIKVAPFNISGDGPVVASTIPIQTPSTVINGLRGTALSPTAISWSWVAVAGATSYSVFATSSNALVANVGANDFTQSGLSTNTAVGIRVQTISPTGTGVLSAGVTVFTQADQPGTGATPFTFLTTGSVIVTWFANTNPVSTKYKLQFTSEISSNPITISSITGNSIGVTGGSPNVQFTFSVLAFNGDGVETSFASLGSTITLANPPQSPVVTLTDPSNIGIAWGGNNNSSSTTYQVLFSTDAFATTVSTHIAFSAGFTGLSTQLGSLLTGRTYTLRVTARNRNGIETASVSTQAFTDNGGGPPGSLSVLVSPTQFTVLAGNIGSGRTVFVRLPPGAFPEGTRVFVSSQGTLSCGNINGAISITASPGAQPALPLEVGIGFTPGEANLGATGTLAISRFHPPTGTCVPLVSRLDTSQNMVLAQVNHLSDFQLQQVAPGSALAGLRVFPNPLYTRTQGYFTFDRLPADARVRVYTLHGEAVADFRANASGLALWNATNLAGRKVASGVYLVVIEGLGDRRMEKLAVVR